MTGWRLSISACGCGALLAVGGQACPLESFSREHWVPLDSVEGDQTTDVATGAGGNMVYISGYKLAGQLGSDGYQDVNAMLMAYNSSGVRQWIVEYGSSADDEGNSVAADSTGVYLAGAVSVPSGTSGSSDKIDDKDAFVVKYNSTGDLLWETSWGTSQPDVGNGVAVDAGSGLVYVVGTTKGSMPTGRRVGDDSGGSLGIEGSVETTAEDIAVNAGGSDVFLSCLGAEDGEIQWTVQFGSAMSDVGTGVAVGPRGGVFLVGQMGDDDDESLAGARAFLAKYDYLGNSQFTARLNSSSTHFAVDLAPSSGSGGEGVVYMSGYTIGDSPGVFLARFEGSTGTQTWLSRLGDETDLQLIAQAVAVVEGSQRSRGVGAGPDSAVSGSDAATGGIPVVEGGEPMERGDDARVVVVGYNRSAASAESHPSTGFTAVADTKGVWEWHTVSQEAERETAIAVGAVSGNGQAAGDTSVFIVGTVAAEDSSPGNYLYLDIQRVEREEQPTPVPSRLSIPTISPTVAEAIGVASTTTGLSQNSSLWLLIIAPIFVVLGCILMMGYVSKQCAIAFGKYPDTLDKPMDRMELSSHGDRDHDVRRSGSKRALRGSSFSSSEWQHEAQTRSKPGRRKRGGEKQKHAWSRAKSLTATFQDRGGRAPYQRLGVRGRPRGNQGQMQESSLRDDDEDEDGWEGEIEMGMTARPTPSDTPRGNGTASYGEGLHAGGEEESQDIDPIDAPHRLEGESEEADWVATLEEEEVHDPRGISCTTGNPRDDEPEDPQNAGSSPFGSPEPPNFFSKQSTCG